MSDSAAPVTPAPAPVAPAPAPPTPAPPAPEPAPLILGKFKTQADLESAYKSLEQKLHAPQAPPAATATPDNGLDLSSIPAAPAAPEVRSVEAVITKAGLKPEDLSKTFTEKGTLTDDQFKAFESAGYSRKDVTDYIAGQAARAQLASIRAETILSDIHAQVGGQQQWDTIRRGLSHLPEARKKDISERLKDPNRYIGALHEAVTEYNNRHGTAGSRVLITGSPTGAPVRIPGYAGPAAGFTNIQEIAAAVSASRANFADPLHPTQGDPAINARLAVTDKSIIAQLGRKR